MADDEAEELLQDNQRLRANNAELLAALEGLLSATGVDAYHAAEDAAHAAIAKAKEASHG